MSIKFYVLNTVARTSNLKKYDQTMVMKLEVTKPVWEGSSNGAGYHADVIDGQVPIVMTEASALAQFGQAGGTGTNLYRGLIKEEDGMVINTDSSVYVYMKEWPRIHPRK